MKEEEYNLRQEEPLVKPYTQVESSRLSRLFELHSEVRLWERFLIRREGQPYKLILRLPNGSTIEQIVNNKSLQDKWDARDSVFDDCVKLGKEEDARELMEQVDLKHKELLQKGGPKIPKAFLK